MLKRLAICIALAFAPVTACSTFSGTPTTQPSVPGAATNAPQLLADAERTFVILQKVLRSPTVGLKGTKAAAAYKANAAAKIALDAARTAVKQGGLNVIALIQIAGSAVFNLTAVIHGP